MLQSLCSFPIHIHLVMTNAGGNAHSLWATVVYFPWWLAGCWYSAPPHLTQQGPKFQDVLEIYKGLVGMNPAASSVTSIPVSTYQIFRFLALNFL